MKVILKRVKIVVSCWTIKKSVEYESGGDTNYGWCACPVYKDVKKAHLRIGDQIKDQTIKSITLLRSVKILRTAVRRLVTLSNSMNHPQLTLV